MGRSPAQLNEPEGPAKPVVGVGSGGGGGGVGCSAWSGSSIIEAAASIAGVVDRGSGIAGRAALDRLVVARLVVVHDRVELAAHGVLHLAQLAHRAADLPGDFGEALCGPKTSKATTRMTRISAWPRFMVRSELT